MKIGKFKFNNTNLEFLINEAWKTKKVLAIKYKGTFLENYIELIDKKEDNIDSDICVISADFQTKEEFNSFIEKCIF